jgi:hypothetical protein
MLKLTVALFVALSSSAGALRLSPLPKRREIARVLRQSRQSLDRRHAISSTAAAAALAFHPELASAAAAAVSAQRFSLEPRITALMGGLGEIGYSRFEDQLSTPKGTKAPAVSVSFDFPSQLTRLPPLGTITLVDGNSGLKVYVLVAKLPDGTTLSETPKAWFGDAIFNADGAISASIDDFKVSSAKMIEAPEGAASARRRLSLKYAVVTPANQRTVDRRALCDVYELDGVAYMLLASGSSSKWDGAEAERCRKMADSFVIRS